VTPSEKKNMKPSQHTISSPLKTTATDVVRWAMELRYLHARMAPSFARASTSPALPVVSARPLE
jgi:hypothetical protein